MMMTETPPIPSEPKLGLGPDIIKSRNHSPSTVLLYTLGIILDITGSCIAVCGLLSNKWILVTRGHSHHSNNDDGTDDNNNNNNNNNNNTTMGNSVGDGTTYHFGPWEACQDRGVCGNPWDIVPGFDRLHVQWSQLLVSSAIIFYLGGVVLMVIKCITRRMGLAKRFNRIPILEIISSTACVTSELFLLLMGELKRSIILYHGQTLTTGHGFILTVIALFMSVSGILIMLLNRNGYDKSTIGIGYSNMEHYNEMKKTAFHNTIDEMDRNITGYNYNSNQTTTSVNLETLEVSSLSSTIKRNNFDIDKLNQRQEKFLDDDKLHSIDSSYTHRVKVKGKKSIHLLLETSNSHNVRLTLDNCNNNKDKIKLSQENLTHIKTDNNEDSIDGCYSNLIFPEDDFLLMEIMPSHLDSSPRRNIAVFTDNKMSYHRSDQESKIEPSVVTSPFPQSPQDDSFATKPVFDSSIQSGACNDRSTSSSSLTMTKETDAERHTPMRKSRSIKKKMNSNSTSTKSDDSGSSGVLSNVKKMAFLAFENKFLSKDDEMSTYPGESGLCVIKSIQI